MNAAEARGRIHIVPYPGVSAAHLIGVGEVVSERFGVEVVVDDPAAMPRDSYDRRKQFLAGVFVSSLRHHAPGAVAVIGIVGEDLYAPGLNFVFGEADPQSRCAIVSTWRLRPERWGQESNKGIFSMRLRKEIIHELGHVFGLAHCRLPGCVMFFSNSLADTDRKSDRFCTDCRSELPARPE